MSAKMERKAKSAVRFQKRESRKNSKPKRRRNGLDSDSDSDTDIKSQSMLAESPIMQGCNVEALNKKKKQKVNEDVIKSVSIRHLPIPIFEVIKVQKNFWTGQPGETDVSDEIKQLRKSLGILVRGNMNLCPQPIISMSSEYIPPSFKKVFTLLNHTTPSPVQMQCWPTILAGANILCIAPTGSGKTLGKYLYTYFFSSFQLFPP